MKYPKFCLWDGSKLVWSLWAKTKYYNEATGKQGEVRFLQCKNTEHDRYSQFVQRRRSK